MVTRFRHSWPTSGLVGTAAHALVLQKSVHNAADAAGVDESGLNGEHSRSRSGPRRHALGLHAIAAAPKSDTRLLFTQSKLITAQLACQKDILDVERAVVESNCRASFAGHLPPLTKRQEGVRLEGCAQAVFSHGRSPASIAALQRRPPGPRCMSPVERHACARAALGLICRSRRARGLPARALPSSGSGAISWARLQRLYPRIAAQKTKGHGSRSVSMKALRRETSSQKAALKRHAERPYLDVALLTVGR